ncbi:hypothetical protein [Microvirga lenta]|uniref:hypothetical protein n=1 Tax=Microvirga lenta TaxID=2881337 RepID=UPI001CFFFD4A|nr:hypothetical protein [Microvirga lenta]MCB5175621.1 hypothetical protein [Microvirga lenta]
MMATAAERPIFENEEWLVTESGLEHKMTGYFIERESLANRRSDGLWTWPMQMAEKSWCAMPLFAEAFSCAASVYEVETGTDLAQTFRLARSEISAWPDGAKPNGNPAPRMLGTLQSKDPNPILWEPERTEKASRDQGFQAPGENPRRHAPTGARALSANARLRETQVGMVRATALPWRTSHRLQRTGTKLVRLLQAAWSIR